MIDYDSRITHSIYMFCMNGLSVFARMICLLGLVAVFVINVFKQSELDGWQDKQGGDFFIILHLEPNFVLVKVTLDSWLFGNQDIM